MQTSLLKNAAQWFRYYLLIIKFFGSFLHPFGFTILMRKFIIILCASALLAASCSTDQDTASDVSNDSVSEDCFTAEANSVSGLQYELDTEEVPDLKTVSEEYNEIDYSIEPAGNALTDFLNDEFEVARYPTSLINLDDVISGGVPVDGIPPIDEPEFAKPADITYIDQCDEPVVSVEINGDARAFPIKVLISHEIINTEIGGVLVTVTYCPLCNSALVVDRRVGTRILDFGVSGTLYNSALIMYDRPTGTMWSHFTGEGLVGHYAGVKLQLIPAQTISYGEFIKNSPDGLVLTDSNEHRTGGYGRNPYVGEDTSDGTSGFLFKGEVDERLPRKERVVGIVLDGQPIAIPFEVLAEERVVVLEEGDEPVVVFYSDGLASPVDAGQVADGRDVGQSGAFKTTVDEKTLTFKYDENTGLFVDNETGSSWNILGNSVLGELKGETLEPVVHLDPFWFAWAAYRPDTTIFGS